MSITERDPDKPGALRVRDAIKRCPRCHKLHTRAECPGTACDCPPGEHIFGCSYYAY